MLLLTIIKVDGYQVYGYQVYKNAKMSKYDTKKKESHREHKIIMTVVDTSNVLSKMYVHSLAFKI